MGGDKQFDLDKALRNAFVAKESIAQEKSRHRIFKKFLKDNKLQIDVDTDEVTGKKDCMLNEPEISLAIYEFMMTQSKKSKASAKDFDKFFRPNNEVKKGLLKLFRNEALGTAGIKAEKKYGAKLKEISKKPPRRAKKGAIESEDSYKDREYELKTRLIYEQKQAQKQQAATNEEKRREGKTTKPRSKRKAGDSPSRKKAKSLKSTSRRTKPRSEGKKDDPSSRKERTLERPSVSPPKEKATPPTAAEEMVAAIDIIMELRSLFENNPKNEVMSLLKSRPINPTTAKVGWEMIQELSNSPRTKTNLKRALNEFLDLEKMAETKPIRALKIAQAKEILGLSEKPVLAEEMVAAIDIIMELRSLFEDNQNHNLMKLLNSRPINPTTAEVGWKMIQELSNSPRTETNLKRALDEFLNLEKMAETKPIRALKIAQAKEILGLPEKPGLATKLRKQIEKGSKAESDSESEPTGHKVKSSKMQH